MIRRRTKNESIENLKRVIDNKNDNVEVVGNVDIVMADAYAESIKNEEHVEEVKKDLEKSAEGITIDDAASENTPEVKNHFTAKLVLDEAINDFNLLTEEENVDGRSNKFYDDDGTDPYLDYDMFDFIYGLVTDCWPKPKNPLGHRMRKFMYVGSDDYLKTNSLMGVGQVASSGDEIIVFANDEADFNDIKAVCELYKFEYKGPLKSRNLKSHWNYSFKINVPVASNGYPQMVEDYFESIGMSLEDVMDTEFCKQYRKRMQKDSDGLQNDYNERKNDERVKKIFDDAVQALWQDGSISLSLGLKNLYTALNNEKLKYNRAQIKADFYDAMSDDFGDVDESIA